MLPLGLCQHGHELSRLLFQVVMICWNIANMSKEKLSFSPVFALLRDTAPVKNKNIRQAVNVCLGLRS